MRLFMKAKSFLLSLFILLLSFALFSCFSPWKGDETTGSFTITLGNGSGRTALPWGDEGIEIEDLVHTIRLFNGPGPEQIREGVKFGQTVNFTVIPGLWDISIKAYDTDNVLRAEALAEGVLIKPGKNGLISITMGPSTPPDKPGEYNVTMQDDGNGTATATPSSAAQGATVNISAAPNNGYKFLQWEVVFGDVSLSPDAETTPATFTMPDNAVTIRALFEELPPDTPYLTLSPVSFDNVLVGYQQPEAKTVTINNTGTGTATVSTIQLTGDNADSFALSEDDDISTIAAGETAAFKVQPRAELDGGTYTAAITVTYDNGETASANLSFTVVVPTSVTVTPATGATVVRGGTLQFSAAVIFNGIVDPPEASQSVIWSVTGGISGGSTDIDTSGLLTVDATEPAGVTLTVTAKSTLDNAITGTVNVTVVNEEPAGVTVTPASNATTVVRGTTLQFSAVVNPPTASQAVEWEVSGSTNTGTSINPSGLLTVATTETAGTVLHVTAKSTMDNAKYGTVDVTVINADPTGVTVTPADNATTVVRGGTLQFSATVIPLTASQDVEWRVSGSTLLGTTISSDGILTVDATETANTSLTVTATSAAFTNVFGSVTVTVANPTLTGTVTIGGDRYIHGTVTASVALSGLSAAATPKYQWKKGGSIITGMTNSEYKLVASDVLQSITVEVTAEGFAESITASNPVNTGNFGVGDVTEWNSAITAISTHGTFVWITVYQNIPSMPATTTANFNASTTFQSPISIRGKTGSEILGLQSVTTGSLLRIGSGQYIRITDLNLQGHTGNTAPLVYVEGSFYMNGGTISGNTNNSGNGGGVFVSNDGTLCIQNGTIYGNESANGDLANNTSSGADGAALYLDGTAKVELHDLSGNRDKPDSPLPSSDLPGTTNSTIKVEQGVWQK